jgi:hypothetical protein
LRGKVHVVTRDRMVWRECECGEGVRSLSVCPWNVGFGGASLLVPM